ncbi:putative metal-dependent hydrolase BCAH187_A2766 [Tenacibaculum sp. 190524A05c]|uniref:YfiT family bacillithiol transferase n=1 Tax=Tenacibaculum platacis TaxID=3137852 RepID=UPI0031FAD34E
MEHLKYPIGKPEIPSDILTEHIENWIQVIEDFPDRLQKLVSNLNQDQLDTPYRDGGWTIRQVVHHCADSHHNSYTRFKWTLTEDKPVIKAYYEERWAELPDSKNGPIELSLNSLKALHSKWVYFLKVLKPEDLEQYFIHPDGNEKVTLKENIGIYAWHCNHHFAHIENLVKRMEW